jgi:prephenate dehydrogenase
VLWRAAGAAKIIELDPEAHDRAVTFASHLPYLAAASVVEALLSSGGGAALARELAAGGFRDTTRVAGDWTLSGAAALNRFLPAAARELADKLAALADELRRNPESAVEKLRALADDRRGMKLPPPPGPSG